MSQSYIVLIRYTDGAKGFICGFDSEFGTPIVGFDVPKPGPHWVPLDPEFMPREYSFGLAERVVETLQESNEVFSSLEIIPAGLFREYFFGEKLCGLTR